MGFFAEFSIWLSGLLNNYIAATTTAVASALTPAVVTLGVVYVMVWGYLLLTGKIEEPFLSGVKRILALALILGCALQLWFYNGIIVDTFFNGPEQLAGRIIGAYDSVTIVDNIISAGNTIAERLLEQDGIIDSITYGLAAIAVYIIVGLTAIYTVFLLSLSRIALAVLLALGPLFIALLLFESTKKFFESWVAQLANYGFIAILTTAVAALMLTLLTKSAQQALDQGEGLTIAHAVRVCMAAGLTFLVLRQVMPMAAGLASGLALSTFGAMSMLMTKAFGGAASSISKSTADFSRGAFLDKQQSHFDSLARRAGYRLKQRLTRRENSVTREHEPKPT